MQPKLIPVFVALWDWQFSFSPWMGCQSIEVYPPSLPTSHYVPLTVRRNLSLHVLLGRGRHSHSLVSCQGTT